MLKHLRRLGCTLPIEVFHYEAEQLDAMDRADIEAMGVKIRTVIAPTGVEHLTVRSFCPNPLVR